ncbi:hypothetical protein FKW77_004879 [Venturia effusa]|uniref:Uncharacterized protein n=1 Tax=Venturia effusa TaxID=50376 RepID=A0A517L5B7_9PEZI|nr:hypothetical protein FKW77_004879 [Venturia effusa]
MCFTFSTNVGSTRRRKSLASSKSSTTSSSGSQTSAIPTPPSAEWISQDRLAKPYRHNDTARQEEGAEAPPEVFCGLRTDKAAVGKRTGRNRLSRQRRLQDDTAQWSSLRRESPSPTESEIDRQWEDRRRRPRPRGWVGPSMVPSIVLSSSISVAASATKQEQRRDSFFHPSTRDQHTSLTDRDAHLAADFQRLEPSSTAPIDVSWKSPRLDRETAPGFRKVSYPLRRVTSTSRSQSSSSSSSSNPSTTSTAATDPPSPKSTNAPRPPHDTNPSTSIIPHSSCPTLATSFNAMVIHHLRNHWPPPTASSDVLTREELLALIHARLRRLPTDVGREWVSVHDSEEDFIERRALIVAQGVRRDLVFEIGERLRRRERREREALEEREFRDTAKAALRFENVGR